MDKNKLENLYSSGKSMTDIADTFNCSVHKVVYWMRKHEITRRSRSDAAYVKANPNGDPFLIKKNYNKDDMFLLGLGLGIYWGEGNKVTPTAIRVTNSDPAMLRVFLNFMSKICNLDTKRLSFSIICFKDTDGESARKYWSQELKISPEKFGKITQIPSQGKGTYRKKSKYGVCIVQGNNIKLKTWMMNELSSLESRIKPD